MLRSCTPSCALFASALIACSSLATGYSFAPSLRAPHGALRSASGACVARPPSRGLSALSMMSKDDAPEEPAPAASSGLSGLVLPSTSDIGRSGLVLLGMEDFGSGLSGLVLPGMEDFGGSGLVLPGMDAFDVSKPDDVEDVAPEAHTPYGRALGPA
ncbi:hypothetical protein T484DRAFT_1849404 [Baffinella frigidus]|nr:hypothetical protein T484DRAFT_1849404 [Cryptophyta sp. CCMP2293]